MAFLNQSELEKIGFKSIGSSVLLSDKASVYNAKNITIGNNVRIDDFCILSAGSGGIEIGNYVHIACYSSLIGDGRIVLKDFSGVSSRTSIYSSNDDYSGEFLTNPMVLSKYTNVKSGPVILEKHVIIGAGSIVLPNVVIGYGTAIGALSLVVKSCEEKMIYIGAPAKKIKPRKTGFELLEKQFLDGL